MLAIASFPRSGNHLYRFLLEFSTGAFTQGCLDNNLDVPIYKNKFSLSPSCLIHVDGTHLLGIKCHSTTEVEKVFSTNPLNGVHLIVRNPLNALASNIGRLSHGELLNIFINNKRMMAQYVLNIPKNRTLSIHRFTLEYFVRQNFLQWSLLLRSYFKTWIYLDCSTLIVYENLMGQDSRVTEITNSLRSIQSFVDTNKYNELVKDIGFFYQVSATGTGRDWGGSRSLKEGELSHLKKTNISSVESFRSLIVSLLIDEKNQCVANINKHPGFFKYKQLLDKYIQQNS